MATLARLIYSFFTGAMNKI